MSVKTEGIWKFCQNTGKTHNLVCSSSKLSDTGHCNIRREFFEFFKSVLPMKLSQISEICTGNISSWTRKKQGNTNL